MRSLEDVALVRALLDAGLNDCEIARQTGIPRCTVRDWRHRRTERARAPVSEVGCPECNWPEHDFAALPSDAYAYLLGQYLGDGHVVQAGRTQRLRIFCCDAYPDVMAEVGRAIETVLLGTKVGSAHGIGCTAVGSYSKQWPCLLPQHGPGMKHTREIRLTDWQIEHCERAPHMLLRGLIHSDGCRCVNRVTAKATGKQYEYPRYLFNNESDDILLIFGAACERVGVQYRWCRDNMLSVARRDDVARLDEFIGPKS